jgi:hypothetical protein
MRMEVKNGLMTAAIVGVVEKEAIMKPKDTAKIKKTTNRM